MEKESSYINFLQTFINEEVYLFDSLNQEEHTEEVNEMVKEPEILEEPKPEQYVSQLSWQGNQEADIAFILDEKLPEDIGKRFKKMLVNAGLKGNQVKSSYFENKEVNLINELDIMNADKLIILSERSFTNPELQDYQPVKHNQLSILKGPAFTHIVNEKDRVLTFWEALSKFLS